MRIYTRSGDKGTTSLVYGVRAAKNDPRVEAYGTVDETNSAIGVALSFLHGEQFPEKEKVEQCFNRVQTMLFHAGAELSTPEGKEVHWKLKQAYIDELEALIDKWDGKLEPLKTFILPGGHPAAAAMHAARTVARRAERASVAVDGVNPLVLSFLNRLSDFLFVAARYINYCLGVKDRPLQLLEE
ncbi:MULTISPECIES: cob(I)yrinic acid a,c-diamide adenosyltransferase [Heyndrickxia]|uniref:cob(I)yrinic acid a,c-diamide adenosyltransferase n=1 Tax=Heyndrickxia TaxID=2837504 RepID=UPI002DBB20EE|nr:cob(I)yrinic acid a,c-diamide adenosyltransferase [Weizmannia sp. CD-2023]MEC2305754.1 cob(I)yrinic acid a,c-diamide adenosyltransferase [Weizmannia sp. CD-2023]MEC2342084.1 cob(I)yrinic acid a,c-diamide adenosyltransferase [Weizmannia sp. CD-2023]